MKNNYLLLVVVIALSACKKDGENAPSRTDLLTGKSWRISAKTTSDTNGGAQPFVIDEYSRFLTCQGDDFVKFNLDKTVVFDTGPTKCNLSSPQATVGNWEFNGDQTKLFYSTYIGSGSYYSYDVIELSSTTLHIRFSNVGSSNVHTEDITYNSF